MATRVFNIPAWEAAFPSSFPAPPRQLLSLFSSPPPPCPPEGQGVAGSLEGNAWAEGTHFQRKTHRVWALLETGYSGRVGRTLFLAPGRAGVRCEVREREGGREEWVCFHLLTPSAQLGAHLSVCTAEGEEGTWSRRCGKAGSLQTRKTGPGEGPQRLQVKSTAARAHGAGVGCRAHRASEGSLA